jgi:alpha-D-ribose 1-methylphosphonate 5-triphosphate diphosphatase PhnM
MSLFEDIEENAVLETLNKVAEARKVAIMELMDTKFGQRQKINKSKQKRVVH